MEADAYRTYPGLRPGNDVADIGLGFYGHYSMCTYFECVNQPWSERCERNGVHADPGAFGFWPLINRPKKDYMMLALAIEVDVPPWGMKLVNLDESTAAALPAECVSPLCFPLQAPVEAAMGNVDPNASALGNLVPDRVHLRAQHGEGSGVSATAFVTNSVRRPIHTFSPPFSSMEPHMGEPAFIVILTY